MPLQKVIANESITRGEELLVWTLNNSDTTYVERNSKYPHMIPSGIACRDFKKGEQFTEVEILLCQLKIKIAKKEADDTTT